jgi:CubicO group peptidase (beta-lactamase class C family)
MPGASAAGAAARKPVYLPGIMDRVRTSLDGLVARASVPGLQYLVLDRDRTLFEYAGGWADLRRRGPMTRDTTMMAYSMSKTITAIAVLQLVAAGKVALEDPIERYHATPYGPGITVRQLLAHLSGIPNPIPLRWVHPAAQHAGFDEHAALDAQLRAHPRPAFAPGKGFRYSNLGYWLLGSVVERASGQSFVSYVAERLLAPLGIPAAALGYAIADPGRHANGYLERRSILNLAKRLLIARQLIGDKEDGWLRIEPHYLNGPAFGGLVGAAHGFGSVLQDQLRPRSVLLDNPARELLYTPQRTAAGRAVPMGLGWHLGDLRGVPFFYKEGGGGGFHCEMRVYRINRVATVLMTNATRFDVTRCLDSLDREFLG